MLIPSGKSHEITYNTNETVWMAFLPKALKTYNVPSVYLENKVLTWVDEYTYLGVYLSSNNSDTRDMGRQKHYIYARGNILCRKFDKCCDDVKLLLFKNYCYNLYCCQLWCNYSLSMLNSVKVAYSLNVINEKIN